MRSKLNILSVSQKGKKNVQIKKTVKQKQNKMKEYTDKKTGAKQPTFKVRDTVCVPKGSSRFSEPLTEESWTKYLPTK